MTTLGITMGCPAGIGPEIIVKYFHGLKEDQGHHNAVVLGDREVLQRCCHELGMPLPIVSWQPGAAINPGTLPVMELSAITNLSWGKPNKETGRAMAKYIATGVELAQQQAIAAIVTCPIAKDTLQAAGFVYPGHTEMLAELTQTSNFTMMMAGPVLRVTLVTLHCRFSEVPQKITSAEIGRIISLTHQALHRDFAIAEPRIAVAGLNPHSGESGLFGDEEITSITPALEKAMAAGIKVSGPHPPDTVFVQAAQGKYDSVVCMYHDQGLIPFKLLHFADGVNVTLGLPIVRTSVDHGTAYDIAGQGKASETSLKAAINMAQEISRNREAARI